MKRSNIFDENGALTKDFLLSLGSCCDNGCVNCPYKTMKNAEICDCCRKELSVDGNFPSIDKKSRLANIEVSLKFEATVDGKQADICRSCAEMIVTGVIRKHLDPKLR